MVACWQVFVWLFFQRDAVATLSPLPQINQLAAFAAEWPVRADFFIPDDIFTAMRAGNYCWFLGVHDN